MPWSTCAHASYGYPGARGYPCTGSVINNFGAPYRMVVGPTLSFFPLSPCGSLSWRTIVRARRQGVFSLTWGEVLYVTYAHSRGTWGWKLDNPLFAMHSCPDRPFGTGFSALGTGLKLNLYEFSRRGRVVKRGFILISSVCTFERFASFWLIFGVLFPPRVDTIVETLWMELYTFDIKYIESL